MTEMLKKEFSRKTFVKGGGAMVVGFSLAGSALAGKAGAATAPTSAGYLPDLTKADSYLRIDPDNTVWLKMSQVEIGNGITTGFLMVAAEELDVPMSQMRYGSSIHDKNGVEIATITDNWNSPNTGGHGGSNAMSGQGPRIRAAAVAARGALLSLAATQFAVPVASLSVKDGVVSGGGKSATYGELVGGKLLNVTIGANLQPGVAPAKPINQYSLVTTRNAPRVDIPAKVEGRYAYLQSIRLPGMLHGRWVRPRGQGPWLTEGFAKPLKVDESSIKHLKGVQLVREGDFVGVVAARSTTRSRLLRS